MEQGLRTAGQGVSSGNCRSLIRRLKGTVVQTEEEERPHRETAGAGSSHPKRQRAREGGDGSSAVVGALSIPWSSAAVGSPV